MTILAKVIADSVGPKTRRLTTFQLTYPRFIHSEFMTHRQFSRNASSSRAIPVERQIEMVVKNPAMPIHWGKNQPGMQALKENTALVHIPAFVPKFPDLYDDDQHKYRKTTWPVSPEDAWLDARDRAVEIARAYAASGYHKQVVNRLLEPFAHISVVCTASQYDNFFALRRHPDAQPEIKALADAMYDAMMHSEPKELEWGHWHLPYIVDEDRFRIRTMDIQGAIREGLLDDLSEDPVFLRSNANRDIPEETARENAILVRLSVARCARVSYMTHEGRRPALEQDLKLYKRLVGAQPLHASPAEHQATPDALIWNEAGLKDWENPHLHGNLRGGWIQYRKLLPGECVDNWESSLNDFG